MSYGDPLAHLDALPVIHSTPAVQSRGHCAKLGCADHAIGLLTLITRLASMFREAGRVAY
jgi:hypothetical protein